ncbi:MAG: ATP synthase A1 subunit C [Candidatus Methanomethylophilaceae archaeon]|nr:ATP synthase A1 subunit C [Candidatus Methanomethylophilaceae archaeon]
MFSRSGKKGNYAYTVARVKAKKSHLLGEEDYNKMLQMSVPEISRYISESGYQKEMVDLAGRLEGIDLVEHATYVNMAKVFSSILSASQGELEVMVAAYLEKWDIWNLKVILRGKSYGLNTDAIMEDLVPAGRLGTESLEKLISLDATEDILANFGRMAKVNPQALLDAYRESGGNFGAIEDYLDKYYYARLIASIDPTSRPTKLFQEYVRKEIDVKNLETILKLKAEGIYGEDVMQYVIPGGKQIDKRLAVQLVNAETIEAAASDLSQLDFYETIRDLVESDSVSIRDVVTEMKKYEIAQAKKFSHLYPLSVVPVIDFMIHKELEVRNIRTVARGIESGLDKETIKGLLVI